MALNISRPVIVNAALPIELLAEKLPVDKLDDLRNIHAAGEEGNYSKQMKLLDSLRKEIAGNISDPKTRTNPILSENLGSCIEAIDAMRASASLKIDGSKNLTELKLATDKSTIPPELFKPMKELRDLASSAGPGVSLATSLYMSRVEACAGIGEFGLIKRYSELMLEELRKFHNESDQPLPQLGVMAARVRNVTEAANGIDQKISLGAGTVVLSKNVATDNAPAKISLQEKASLPVFNPGSYLFSSLQLTPKDSEPGNKKKSGLGL